MSSFNLIKFLRKFVDIVERDGHKLNDGFSDVFFTKIFLFQESCGDIEQSVLWPWEEPIDDGTVNKGGELSGSSSQRLSDR